MKDQDRGAFAALDGEGNGQSGITRLEYFAGQVAAGMASITSIDWSKGDEMTAPEGFSKCVFDVAEALCRESEKRKKA